MAALIPAQEDLPGLSPPVDPAALQTLMCRAGLAVAVLDETGQLSMLSPGLEHLLQRSFTAVPAESLAEAFHLYSEGGTRLLQAHEVPIVRASRGEVVEDAIVTVRAPGQPVRHLCVNATPIVGPSGERQGAWAVMTDVTSLVAAARGELSRTLAETVNHNLRTPLTTMLCHAELLLDQQDDFPPEATRSLQAVWHAGQRLHDVVTSISEWIDLAYARGGEGRGADLAELASILHPNATPDLGDTVTRKVGPDGRTTSVRADVVGGGAPDTYPGSRITAQPASAESTSLGGVVSSRQVDLLSAINRVDDGFLALDRDWRVRFVNDAAARHLGRKAGDLLGKSIWQEFPTAVGSTFDHRYREAMESQQRVEFDEYFELLDVWFSIRVYPSPDGVTLVFRDVTGLRSLMAERRAFVERLLTAQDRERARIAADVHEDSLQALGAVAVQLHLLRAHLCAAPPMVRSLLDALDQQVSRATDRLRTLLFSLEPTPADVPISQSIRTQAAHIFDGSSIHWSVDDIDGGEELGRAERSQALRVTKEALSNVLAHAQATEVIVTLQGDEAGVEIVISDNGVAADPADFTSAPGHRGLETMQDRAAEFGGRCTIEPTTPHGCTVRLRLPREVVAPRRSSAQ